jgi:hypothetical protein
MTTAGTEARGHGRAGAPPHPRTAFALRALFLCACCACASVSLSRAQQQCPDGTPPPCRAAQAPRTPRHTRPAAVFLSDSALAVTIRTDLRGLFGDRDTAGTEWRDGTITWTGPDGARTAPLGLRTRGMWRLRECEIPPIRLRFTDSLVRGTLWEDAGRPKLVSPCYNRDNYEQWVLAEYAIYRVFRLFTPLTFAARLLRVTFEDSAGRGRPITRYAFVTEDPERLAGRFGGTIIKPDTGAPLGRLSPAYNALLGVFQYFIANTDWSIRGLHNIELVRIADTTFGIPFDFDWAGVVGAPYARPAPQLPIRDVSERYYLGFCQAETVLEPALARFESLRDSVAAIYRALPGLEPRTLEQTLRFYDGFYVAIANRERFFQRIVGRECRR